MHELSEKTQFTHCQLHQDPLIQIFIQLNSEYNDFLSSSTTLRNYTLCLILHQNVNTSFDNKTKQRPENHYWIAFMSLYHPTPYIVVTGSSWVKQSWSWPHQHNSTLNFIFELGPLNHLSSFADVTGAGLSLNITLWQYFVPYIDLCQVANKRLVCNELSSNYVLVLPDHGGTSRGNMAVLYKAAPLLTDTPSM